MSRIRTVVSTHWLREQLGNIAKHKASRKLRILDTSFQKNKEVDTYTSHYLSGHIPQSMFFSLHNCVESTQEIPRNLPKPDCFQRYIQNLGVWPETHVIAYDRFGPSAAFRLWWLFRLFGHRNVSVLDGGLKKWVKDGYETTTDFAFTEFSEEFTAKMDLSLIRYYEDMMKNVETNEEQVLDARSPNAESVTGDSPDAGVIPGTKHVPFDDLYNKDGTLKSHDELQKLFTERGVDLEAPMVASCFTGMTACSIAAAAHVLGKDIPVYYGAWTEWRQRAPEKIKQRVKM